MIDEEPIVYGNELYQVELNQGLSVEEQAEAENLLRWIKGVRPFCGITGVMLVTGDIRQGKDTFANVLTWKIKRYFKGIRILRDDAPTPIYGAYQEFNDNTIASDIGGMKDVAVGQFGGDGMNVEMIKEKVSKWVSERGQVLVQNAVVSMTEFWNYMNKFRTSSEINIALGGLFKTCGHSETFYIGIAQTQDDIDRYNGLRWVQHQVKCQMSTTKPNTIEAHWYYVKYNSTWRRLAPIIPRPIKITIDAGKERPELGVKSIDPDGTVHFNRYWDLFNSKSAPVIRLNRKNLDLGER